MASVRTAESSSHGSEVDLQDVDVIYETGLTTSNIDDVMKSLGFSHLLYGHLKGIWVPP